MWLRERYCSGILEFLNQTPIDWFSKRQNQVETATSGSEFMVALQGVQRLIDLCYTLRSFGVPVDTAWMFGDNQTVVNSSTIPHSTLRGAHQLDQSVWIGILSGLLHKKFLAR